MDAIAISLVIISYTSQTERNDDSCCRLQTKLSHFFTKMYKYDDTLRLLFQFNVEGLLSYSLKGIGCCWMTVL